MIIKNLKLHSSVFPTWYSAISDQEKLVTIWFNLGKLTITHGEEKFIKQISEDLCHCYLSWNDVISHYPMKFDGIVPKYITI